MGASRFLTLTFGPAALVSLSYWVARPEPSFCAPSAELRPTSRTGVADAARPDDLAHACHRRADDLRRRLGLGCHVIVRVPFVLAGDGSPTELDRIHRVVVVPTARALAATYFDRAPDAPVAILTFSDEQSFVEAARRLDRRNAAGYYGYYVRAERRVMVNGATGYGTLGHELTHALSHFDFPQMPEWLDEGLAALHEQCEFSEDGLRLVGLPNWRRRIAQQALSDGSLETLEAFVGRGRIRPSREAQDYAHAREICLYLQRRDVLVPYYRAVRRNAHRDPTGLRTLRELLGTRSLDEVERLFRAGIRESS